MKTIGTRRTFEPVKIKFGIASIICQTDSWTGERIPSDQVTETHMVMFPTLEFRGLTQGFRVLAKIEQKDFNKESLEKKMKAALVSGLAKRILFDFFQTVQITVKKSSPELNAYESVSKLDALIAVDLEKQAKFANESVKQWRAAINEIDEGLRDGFQYNRRKIQDGLMFLEWCHRSANNDMMYGWCEEKLGRIRANLADLSQRKNSHHPTFEQRVNEIRGYLARWPIANSWHEQPPQRTQTSS